MEGAAVLLPGIMGGYQAETRKELGKSFKSRRDRPAEQSSRLSHQLHQLAGVDLQVVGRRDRLGLLAGVFASVHEEVGGMVRGAGPGLSTRRWHAA